jgi:hypothetical protein
VEEKILGLVAHMAALLASRDASLWPSGSV